ncbi:MAG: SusD/RagB family nutrient-binding outer membrane lipoprotein [Cyclobacteriaceae bacterium]
MKIKWINRQVFLCILVLMVFSCTQSFDEINQNPNVPEEIDPQFLLSNVISEAADQNTYHQGFRLANYLVQFASSVEFERIDRYEMGSNVQYWDVIFRLLNDLESIQHNPASNEAYNAVADILKSYLFSQLTDLWGDVPYTEALQAKDGLILPKYDTQESIYSDSETGIIAVLKRSAATLANTSAVIHGDMMFSNDLDKWRRFANSLQFRFLMRISNRLNDYSELIALAESGALMRGNGDNAVVPYLNLAPNQWPMSQAALGLYQEHRMSLTVDSVLVSWNDPRQSVLYKPTQQSLTDGNPLFKGLQNGLNRETISEQGINLNDISLFGMIFRDIPDGVDGQFMQFAELQFALAEAVALGFIPGDVQTFYEKGIKASFEYYQVEVPDDYMNRQGVILDAGQELTKILTQKWVSLINNGHEAWFNIRRTGIPKLIPGPDNLNDGRYPVRYLYPESEQATNGGNYQDAVHRMGGDGINNKGWWEK